MRGAGAGAAPAAGTAPPGRGACALPRRRTVIPEKIEGKRLLVQEIHLKRKI